MKAIVELDLTAHNFKSLRVRLGFTSADDFGEKVGLGASTVRALESGDQGVLFETIRLAAEGLSKLLRRKGLLSRDVTVEDVRGLVARASEAA